MLKLSRNAPKRHTGTFWKGGTPYRNFWRRLRRNDRLAFRLGLDTACLTTSCRLQVYRLKECTCIWCVYVNMVTFLLFMFCSVSLYIHNCWNNNPNNCYQHPSSGHKMYQICFRPGLRPGPRWGSSRRSPRRLGGGHPSLFLSPRRLDSHAFGVRLGDFLR